MGLTTLPDCSHIITQKGSSLLLPLLSAQLESGSVQFVRLVGGSLDYDTWETWGAGTQVEVEGAR
jgi:hypothetical protein